MNKIPKFFKKIKLFLYILLVSLLLLELSLRLSGWHENPSIYDEIADPDIRWIHTAGFEGNAFLTYVKINSKHLRDYEYPYKKPKDSFRIISVGECTAFGHSVSLDESFPKQLEMILKRNESLKHYEVINAGLVQYNDLQKVKFVEKYGLMYNPDLIIFSHDLGNKWWIEIRDRLRPFRLIAKKIPKNIHSLRYLIIYIENISTKRWLAKLENENSADLIKMRYSGYGLNNQKIDEALYKLAKISKERHIPAIVVFFPWLDNLEENKYLFGWVHKLYMDKCQNNNLIFLDLYQTYFKNKDSKLFWSSTETYRPNAIAHKIIAEQVYDLLLAQKLLVGR